MEPLRYAQYILFFVFLLCGWGFLRMRRGKPYGVLLQVIPFTLLFLLSWDPFSLLLAGSLEWQVPPLAAPPSGEQAIVVLSAGLRVIHPPQPPVLADFDTFSRCQHAAWLYQHGWRIPVVATGGQTRGGNLADVMAGLLESNGVAPEQIWKEGASKSTYENAVFTYRLLQPRGIRRILLVTSAMHMPRARAAFRKAGFDVVASPCVYTTADYPGTWVDWLFPTPDALMRSDGVLHEWLGLTLYKLRGRL